MGIAAAVGQPVKSAHSKRMLTNQEVRRDAIDLADRDQFAVGDI
jgi:hypothetical protein